MILFNLNRNHYLTDEYKKELKISTYLYLAILVFNFTWKQ